jgi:hypothetical protein
MLSKVLSNPFYIHVTSFASCYSNNGFYSTQMASNSFKESFFNNAPAQPPPHPSLPALPHFIIGGDSNYNRVSADTEPGVSKKWVVSIALVLIRLKTHLPKKTLRMDDSTNVADAKEGISNIRIPLLCSQIPFEVFTEPS